MGVFVVLCIILFTYFVISIYNFLKLRPKDFPPGPPRLPIWGSYWFLLKENYYFLEKSVESIAKRYKTNILGLFLGPFPTVVVFGNELCKEVLTRDEFSGRNDTILTRNRTFGELLGLFFVDGPYWKEQRRFSLRHLRDYGFGRRFASTEHRFESELRDLIDFISSDPKPEDLDVCRRKGQILTPDIFFAPSLNALTPMVLGRQFDSRKLRDLSRSILTFLQSSDSTGGAVSATPWLRHIAPDFFGFTPVLEVNKILKDFVEEEVLNRKAKFSNDHHGDFTDVYLSKLMDIKETNGSFSEKQLIWTLIDFIFPAPVTIANTLNYLWAYLLIYPDIQRKIQEEIDSVVGRSRLPNLDDRKSMPYTEAVLRETLRINPNNPMGIPRRATTDTTLRGYFIPKDCFIIVHALSAHHDPKVWGADPDKFRPERFLDSDGALLKKDYSIPFGAGARLCAGETFARQTMFLLVAALCQNFTFKAADKLPDINKQQWGVLLSMESSWVKAECR